MERDREWQGKDTWSTWKTAWEKKEGRDFCGCMSICKILAMIPWSQIRRYLWSSSVNTSALRFSLNWDSLTVQEVLCCCHWTSCGHVHICVCVCVCVCLCVCVWDKDTQDIMRSGEYSLMVEFIVFCILCNWKYILLGMIMRTYNVAVIIKGWLCLLGALLLLYLPTELFWKF